MSQVISANYRTLENDEIDSVAAECAQAWQSGLIPERQYEFAVKSELEGYRRGIPCAPFDALRACLSYIPDTVLRSNPKLLDIGASAGYYSDVLKIAGIECEYQALDYSQAFKDLAAKLYPGLAFDVGDARQLPYADSAFDIVLNGAVLMHVKEWRQVIKETARVASRYVIFHRTPVLFHRQTEFFVKDAYGVKCLEIHYNEDELLAAFLENGLKLVHAEDVFFDYVQGFGHRTYLLEGSQVSDETVLSVGDKMRFSVELIEQLREYGIHDGGSEILAVDEIRSHDGFKEVRLRRFDPNA